MKSCMAVPQGQVMNSREAREDSGPSMCLGADGGLMGPAEHGKLRKFCQDCEDGERGRNALMVCSYTFAIASGVLSMNPSWTALDQKPEMRLQ
jgi:hypothetical protein